MARENPHFEKSDSVVEPLRAIDNKIIKKHRLRDYDHYIYGACAYLASLRARRESLESGSGDKYRTSQTASPVLEMRTFSEILRDEFNTLKSSGIIKTLDSIKEKIREEESELEQALGGKKEEIEEKDKRIYDLFIDIMYGTNHLNNFYEDLGGLIGGIFLQDSEFADAYRYFTEKYEEIEKQDKPESKIARERTSLVGRQLSTQAILIRNSLINMKKRRN